MKSLTKNKSDADIYKFPKAPTGIQGLDEITFGGLPKNRSTLLVGNTGCGKTLMAMELPGESNLKLGELIYYDRYLGTCLLFKISEQKTRLY